MAIDIKMDAEAINAAVSAVVLQQLTGEQRDAIFQEAVNNLLRPDKSYSYDKRTPLQVIFDQAVFEATGRIVAELVTETPKFEAKIRQETVKALDALLDDDSEYALREQIGQAIAGAVSSWSRRNRD